MSVTDSLNPIQKEAASYTEGPLLILAGAGSGKTRVLTHRIAYLIDEMGVNPWNIMAITFTNKAAQEMRDRVNRLVEFGAESIWVATFHSSCVRILRRFIDRIGYDNNFTIYDTDDQKAAIRKVVKELSLDPKQYKEGQVLAHISRAKNAMQEPDEMMLAAGGDYRARKEAEIYEGYQKLLRDNNALDFDDLLLLTVRLLRQVHEVLDYYQERFHYIHVDEYQDTNSVQFELIRLLSGKYHNLCVVGDDDQSIYKFRGADITNILSFEEAFPGARVIKLEQNYRSTNNILNAANEVIANNISRKKKRLWSENGDGQQVAFRYFDTAYGEADGIIDEIKEAVSLGKHTYQEIAILYRTNAQSRAFEEKCITRSVPYRLVGGVNFYQRQEIKDILAYLKTIDSARDDLAVSRIVNVPKRGIGQASLNKVAVYAAERGLRLFQAMEQAEKIPGLGKAADKIRGFVNQIMVFRAYAKEADTAGLIEEILEQTGYLEELESLEAEKAEDKANNLEELVNKASDYVLNHEDATLSDFLGEVALVADIDSLDREADCLTLMTLHGAKGLEFPVVYIAGMEEGLFPSQLSIDSPDPGEVEEERRLCYVGITRAMQELTLTAAKLRMVHGTNQFHALSRFIREIPEEMLDWKEGAERSAYYADTHRAGTGMYTAIEAQLRNNARDSYGRGFAEESISLSQPKKKPAGADSLYLSYGKVSEMEKPGSLEYGVGDRVQHVKWGAGTVLEIVDIKKDYQVTVAFDTNGQKKMLAGFAKLKKL